LRSPRGARRCIRARTRWRRRSFLLCLAWARHYRRRVRAADLCCEEEPVNSNRPTAVSFVAVPPRSVFRGPSPRSLRRLAVRLRRTLSYISTGTGWHLILAPRGYRYSIIRLQSVCEVPEVDARRSVSPVAQAVTRLISLTVSYLLTTSNMYVEVAPPAALREAPRSPLRMPQTRSKEPL